MSLELYYSPSFSRSIRHLGVQQRKIIGLILEAISVYYSSACKIAEAQKITPQFFYKQLRKPYYESGVERNMRVIIRRENEKCIVIIAGNHDQIKQFLVHL